MKQRNGIGEYQREQKIKREWEGEAQEDRQALDEPDEWDTVPGHMQVEPKQKEEDGLNIEATGGPNP